MESGGNVELGAYQDNNSGQTRISIHDCPLSKSTCKLLNRVVPNGTLRGVEGEGQISPIRLFFLIERTWEILYRLKNDETYLGYGEYGKKTVLFLVMGSGNTFYSLFINILCILVIRIFRDIPNNYCPRKKPPIYARLWI